MAPPALTPMRALTVALSVAAAVVLAPLWAPLVLAAWFADLLGPAVRRLERMLRGRRRAAAAVVVLLAVGALLPLGGLVAAVVSGVRELLDQVRAALEGHGSLAGALLGGARAGARPEVHDWADLVSRYGASAWAALSAVARASAIAAISILVFVAALFTFTVEGERAYAWLQANVPIPREALARLARAFRETGRGLLVAGGGTAIAQGAVATIAYVAIGIPRALLLGPLTAVCAIVPAIGTGLVWIPLAIELAATGEYWRSAVVVALGAGVHSLIDNFVRPFLARYGHLDMPAFLVLISMLGGVAILGAAGALLGPLVVRLCIESFAILSETQRQGSLGPAEAETLAEPDRVAGDRAEQPLTSTDRARSARVGSS
jgi:predicted PurR-regulated permease PerM